MDLLSLYHALPYPLKIAAASLRGARLAAARYSPDSPRLIDEARVREAYTADQWRAYQEERLAPLLRRAAEKVPYYRAQWAQRRAHGDRSSVERLENWPILTKDVLRETPLAFVADDRNARRLVADHTSGTTGKPLTIYAGRGAVAAWYALHTLRTLQWNGLSRRDRWAILGGQLVAPVERKTPPFWVWNQALNQLYLSAYHIEPRTVVNYAHALADHRVRYLLGYPSAMHALAQGFLEQGVTYPPLKAAIANAEPLYASQRESIERTFGCPVRETYGASEMVVGASECEAGRLHLWPDAGVLEVVSPAGDTPARAGEAGRFICTGLLNDDMPLIRYEIGDLGFLASGAEPCACGRAMPVIASVEGRSDDVIITPEGRRVGRLDPVFKAAFAIREAQIIQEDAATLRVKIVAAPGYTAKQGDEITARLRDRVGEMRVLVEVVESIPRTKNGKFRAVINAHSSRQS